MPSTSSLPRRLLITGATGLVGDALVTRIREVDPSVELRALSRHPKRNAIRGVQMFGWSPSERELDPAALDGVTGVFHLAGETVAQRWTQEVRQRIHTSRIDALDLIREACETAGSTPRLVSASAIGWYPDSPESMAESDAAGPGFIADVVQAWEKAAHRFGALGGQHVSLRIGLVLSPKGGVLAKLLPLYRLGLGSPLAPGTQWQSWIHIDDLVSLFLHAMSTPDMDGAYNAVSPNPVTQRQFSQALAGALRRPHFLPAVPRFVLRAVFGEAAAALLASNRIEPKRTLESGFEFGHAFLPAALASLLR